jgi:hypothetical protein
MEVFPAFSVGKEMSDNVRLCFFARKHDAKWLANRILGRRMMFNGSFSAFSGGREATSSSLSIPLQEKYRC